MNIKIVALCVALFMVFVVGLFGYCTGWKDCVEQDTSTTYEAPAIIKEVNNETGWISFVDWNGEAWYIRGEGYEVGQLIIAVFNDNATESIYDDLVVEVKQIEGIE